MATTDNVNNVAFDDSIVEQLQSLTMTQEQVLRSIDLSLKELVKDNNISLSQSALNDRYRTSRDSRFGRNDSTGRFGDSDQFRWDASRMRQRGQSVEKSIDDFFEEFERQMWQSIAGDPITKTLDPIITDFANKLGGSVEDIGKNLGKKLGQNIGNKIKETDFGKQLASDLTDIKGQFTNKLQGGLNGVVDSINTGGGIKDTLKSFAKGADLPDNLADFTKALKGGAGNILKLGQNSGKILQGVQAGFTSGGLSGALSGASTAISQLGAGALSAFPALTTLATAATGVGLALVAATVIIKIGQKVVEKFKEALQPAIEATKEFAASLKESANKDQDIATKRVEEYKKRIQKDNEAYIRAPFKILEDAAQTVYDVWDNVAKTIGQTQGYDKAGLQDLWSNYAKRLQEEGLSSVVSSADILSGLEKVLQSGLSGQVAEEFAYQATVLGNAIPTEDFFNYASTYASIAANAIKNGKSQQEAIAKANEELEQFASNLLYASRELAGGFSSGLSNASGLFEASAKIANAAHTDNAKDISGVLTSVAAIVGAIAPSLTDSIVTKITDAATGGNSTELVALRSLAGVGASNTAFLQALAKDPQEVFTTMFANLAEMQNMYGDNYMEVAESLASTFGLSVDALSQIDFGYLAQAVSSMDLNNATLNDNIALLASGSTTLTADQLRTQQINQYMIDEGLSYVLDNEVARAIQQHLWDEELANKLMENTYSTELTGSGLSFLQGLENTTNNIFTMLNPFGWMKKVESLSSTIEEGIALNADIARMLEMTNLGSSHPETLYALTHSVGGINRTKSFIQLLGSTSLYNAAQAKHAVLGTLLGNRYTASDAVKNVVATAITATRRPSTGTVSSQYTWSTIGKSLTQSLFTTGNKALYNSGSAYEDVNMSPQQLITTRAAKNMQAYLDTMQTFVDENKSYEEWRESASEFGIEDLETALSDYELTEVDTKGKFQEMEAVKAAMYNHERDLKEEQFWDDMIKWAEEEFPAYRDTVYGYYGTIISTEKDILTNTDLIIGELKKANTQLKEFYDQWIDYYVNHTAYHRDTLNAHEVEAIKTAEAGETGDAVFALAQALTDNLVNLQDPEVQQNALLSQILLVVEAIFQIENNTTTVSLPTALSSLGLGVTSVENQY